MASDNKHQPFVSLEFVTCRNMLWQEKEILIDFFPPDRTQEGGLPWGRRGIYGKVGYPVPGNENNKKGNAMVSV